MENGLIKSPSSEIQIINEQKMELFQERFKYIREDMQDNPYVIETLRVLPVGGFRSAIGSFWNAYLRPAGLPSKVTASEIRKWLALTPAPEFGSSVRRSIGLKLSA